MRRLFLSAASCTWQSLVVGRDDTEKDDFMSNSTPLPSLLDAIVILLGCTPISMGATNLRTVVLSGQPAPGITAAQFSAIGSYGYNASHAGTAIQNFELNDAGQVAFVGVVTGTEVNDLNNEGIWIEHANGFELVARENSPAPGTNNARFGSMDAFSLNDNGHIALISFLRGTNIDESNDQGIWSNRSGELTPIVVEAMAAPGTPAGTVFGGSSGPWIPPAFSADVSGRIAFDNNGRVTFQAKLRGDQVDDTNNEGIWSDRTGTLTLIVREGAEAPGTNGLRFLSPPPGCGEVCLEPSAFEHYTTNDAGQIAFEGTVSGDIRGIWSEGTGSLQLLALSGMQAPGTPDGVLFDRFEFDSAGISNSGAGFFAAQLRGPGIVFENGSGLWTNRSGKLELVARASSPTPDASTTFDFFASFFGLNDDDQIVFRAFLDGTIDTLWSDVSGELSIVARDGQIAPGTNNPFTFIEFGPRAINNRGQVVFMAEANTDRGIWASDPTGELRLVVRVGDTIEVDPGDQRTVIALSNGMTPDQFNDAGQLAFWAQLSGGLEGIFVATLPGSLPGDFNQDATVDAADYVVWRDGLGTVYTQEDYNIWRNNFGRMLASVGTNGAEGFASAPEPASALLLLSALVAASLAPRRCL
jgi:hypothetical protein